MVIEPLRDELHRQIGALPADVLAEVADFTASVIRLARLTAVDPAVDPTVIQAKLGEIGPDRLKSIQRRLVTWLQT